MSRIPVFGRFNTKLALAPISARRMSPILVHMAINAQQNNEFMLPTTRKLGASSIQTLQEQFDRYCAAVTDGERQRHSNQRIKPQEAAMPARDNRCHAVTPPESPCPGGHGEPMGPPIMHVPARKELHRPG